MERDGVWEGVREEVLYRNVSASETINFLPALDNFLGRYELEFCLKKKKQINLIDEYLKKHIIWTMSMIFYIIAFFELNKEIMYKLRNVQNCLAQEAKVYL